MEFFWLSRVMTIWVACWKLPMVASGGRRVSPTKNTNYRGWNWTDLQWLVDLVNSQ